MAKSQVVKISDGALLENLEDGKIVDAEEWNSVMQTIKETVNENARTLFDAGVSAIQIIVSPNSTSYSNVKTWVPAGNYYSVTLTADDYKIQGPKNIKTYLIQNIQSNGDPGNILEEVQNNIKYDPNNSTVTISSRTNLLTLVIIQGVGV